MIYDRIDICINIRINIRRKDGKSVKKIITAVLCLLAASLSLSSCGREKAEGGAGRQAEEGTGKVLVAFSPTAATQECWQRRLPGIRAEICSG